MVLGVGWSEIWETTPMFFGGRFIKIARFCSLLAVQSLQLEMGRVF